MNKELNVIILETSKYMDNIWNRCKHIALSIIESKMINNSKAEICIIYTGKDNKCPAKYENICLIMPFKIASIDHLKIILDAETSIDSYPDILELLTFAIEQICSQPLIESYSKKIIHYITSTSGTAKERNLISIICNVMKQYNILLEVFSLNSPKLHIEKYVPSVDINDLSHTPIQNIIILKYICEEINRTNRDKSVINDISTISTAHKFIGHKASSRVHSRCKLNICGIEMHIQIYVLLQKETLPYMPKAVKGSDIEIFKHYSTSTKPLEFVADIERVKMFEIGKEFVIPEHCIPNDVWDGIPLEKEMLGLGFIDANEIPYHLLLGEARFIEFDSKCQNNSEEEIFSIFCNEMRKKRQGLMVQWVWRDKAQPLIGVCFPFEVGNSLFFIQLPYIDEQRIWNLKPQESVSKLNIHQTEVIDTLINELTSTDIIKIGEVHNPSLLSFHGLLRKKFFMAMGYQNVPYELLYGYATEQTSISNIQEQLYYKYTENINRLTDAYNL